MTERTKYKQRIVTECMDKGGRFNLNKARQILWEADRNQSGAAFLEALGEVNSAYPTFVFREWVHSLETDVFSFDLTELAESEV